MKDKRKGVETLKIYAWTLSYFKYCAFLTLVYIVAGGVLIWGEVTIPRQIGYIIKSVIPSANSDLMYQKVLFLVGIVGVILASKAIFQIIEVIISNRIIKIQQMDLMTKLQKLGFAFYEENPIGRVLSIGGAKTVNCLI